MNEGICKGGQWEVGLEHSIPGQCLGTCGGCSSSEVLGDRGMGYWCGHSP